MNWRRVIMAKGDTWWSDGQGRLVERRPLSFGGVSKSSRQRRLDIQARWDIRRMERATAKDAASRRQGRL